MQQHGHPGPATSPCPPLHLASLISLCRLHTHLSASAPPKSSISTEAKLALLVSCGRFSQWGDLERVGPHQTPSPPNSKAESEEGLGPALGPP